MKEGERNRSAVRRGDWRELVGRREEFQAIVRLLTEFDERTGRFRRFGDPETHYMRRALCVCDCEQLRVFFRALGGYVYRVAVELRGRCGSVATGWVHEDGIRGERETFAHESGHPVHGIVCLTDLYENDCVERAWKPGNGYGVAGPSVALQEVMDESLEEVEAG